MSDTKVNFEQLQNEGKGFFVKFDSIDDLEYQLLQKDNLSRLLVVFIPDDFYFNLKPQPSTPSLDFRLSTMRLLGVPLNNSKDLPDGHAWLKFTTQNNEI